MVAELYVRLMDNESMRSEEVGQTSLPCVVRHTCTLTCISTHSHPRHRVRTPQERTRMALAEEAAEVDMESYLVEDRKGREDVEKKARELRGEARQRRAKFQAHYKAFHGGVVSAAQPILRAFPRSHPVLLREV